MFWAFFLESAFLLWIATPCCRKTRDDNRGLVWHTARDDRKGALCEKVDSRILGLESTFENAKNASEPAKDSRGWALFVICALVSLWDSRICVFVCVDCHADKSARNDRIGELACDVKVDSRIFELKTAFFGVELLALDLLKKLRLRLVLCF